MRNASQPVTLRDRDSSDSSEQCPHQQPHPDVFAGDYDSPQANVHRKVADMEKQVTHCENTARDASPGNYLLLFLVSNARGAPILLLIIQQNNGSFELPFRKTKANTYQTHANTCYEDEETPFRGQMSQRKKNRPTSFYPSSSISG